MLNWRMFLTFLSVVLIIMGSVHGYLFFRLVEATALPDPWRTGLLVFLVMAVLSIPSSFLASRRLDRRVARFVVIPVYLWMGFAFQTFFLVLGVDLVRAGGDLLLGFFLTDPLFPDPDTALAAWRWTAGASVSLTFLATLFAVWWGLTRLIVRRIEVTLPHLPPEMDGFTILHLSDLHLDLVHGRKWMKAVVRKANGLQADLMAITGDLAEGTVAQFGHDADPIRELRAPQGVFFVTGNHEYFHDLQGWLAYLRNRGVRVLRNQRVEIVGRGGSFHLAGVDDHDGARLAPGHGPDLEKVFEGLEEGSPLVLLAHQPRIVREIPRDRVGLVLSGHTHGGQIWPFSYLVYLQQPFVRGLAEERGIQLYISSGTGFWGPPMRLGTTAEMALITLRSPGPCGS
jgi:predicted MPP superfamily phosphohydrolase